MKPSLLIVFTLIFTILGCKPKTTEEYISAAQELAQDSKYQQAIIELKNAILAAPQDQEARLELGRVYLLASQFVNAEKELKLAKELKADKNQYFPLLLKSIYYQNDFDRALILSQNFESDELSIMSTVSLFHYLSYLRDEKYGEKMELPSGLIGDDELVALAYKALADKKPDDAMTFINQFADPEKETAEKAMLTALTNTSIGNVSEAIVNYQTLLKIYPEYYIARFQLAELLIYNNELVKAESEVAYLYKLNPKGAYANLLTAKINFKQDKFDLALTFAEQAIFNGMNSVEANFLAGISAYKTGKIETARLYLSKITSNLPGNHVANKILAEINLKLGYTEEALQQIEHFQLNSKAKATVLSNAAVQQFQIGNFLKAKEFINEANEADPENAVNLLKEGFIKLSSNDSSGIQDLTQAIKFDQSIDEAWLLIAETHLKDGNPAAALDIARKWQQTNLADGLSLEGYINLKTNNIDAAKTVFKKILALEPEHIGANRFLMMIYARESNYDGASTLSKKLIELNPTQLSTILTLVNISIAQDNVSEVQDYLADLSKNNPQNQAAIIANALVFAWQKNPEKALEYLNKTADQNNSQVIMIKGDLYRSIGKTDKALEQYDLWTSLYPKDANAWFRKIDLTQSTNDIPKSLAATIDALKYFPNEPRFRALNARFLLDSGKIEEARKQYNSIKVYEPQLPTLKLFNGEIALQENRFKEAKQLLGEFYAANPTFDSAKLLAQSMQELGEAEEGGKILEKELAKLEKPFVQVHAIAEYYAENNLLQKAAEIYADLLQKYPQHYITINNYAAVLTRQGELDKAEELANVTMQLRPKSAYSLDLLGWVLFKQQKYAESLIYLIKANELMPQNPEIQMHLAEAYYANDQKLNGDSLLRKITPVTKNQKLYFEELRQKHTS